MDLYENALAYLNSLVNFERGKEPKSADFALDNIKQAYELLGISKGGYPPVIHIAGTKGKGSTAHFTAAILTAAGFKTGLFTSPHLLDVRERIVIGNEMISKTDFTNILLNDLRPLAPSVRLSYFEALNLCALIYFKRENVDYVVLETGIGGRLDSTNIMSPLICAITNIALDHTEVLGNTIEEIAAEKGGIIKPRVKIVTPMSQNAAALKVIADKAESLDAALILAPIYEGNMAMFGDFQRVNSGIAAKICEEIGVEREKIEQGIAFMTLPGRGEIVADRFTSDGKSSGIVIFDGAHNPYALAALLKSIETEYPGKKINILLGILEDKNWREMVEMAVENENIDKITFVTAPNPRAVSAKKLFDYASSFVGEKSMVKEIFISDDLHSAVTQNANSLTLITGSFYIYFMLDRA